MTSILKPDSKWVRNKSDEVAIDRGCWFDIDAADRVRHFFARFLRHSKGEFAGKPFELSDWQWDRVIAPAFGWKMPDGSRRFRRIGVGVPKKNGKSTLLSGVALYGLLWDHEPGAEVYTAAADKAQASIIYNESMSMVEVSPALRGRISLKKAAKEMTYGSCLYKAMSSDVPTKEGYNTHFLLFDEIHAQPNWLLWNVFRYSFAARRQPMLWWITTAGLWDPTALGYTQWQDAKSIQESRTVDISFLPCIYEADPSDPWDSPTTWEKVNPSYGHTISPRTLEEDCEAARRIPSEQASFERYRINRWVRQANPWIPWEEWDACRSDYTAESLRRAKCWPGLDLASTTDIAALVLLFRDKERMYKILPFFWIPEGALERRRRENRARMDAWAGSYIKVTPGKTLDYRIIRNDINSLASLYRMPKIGLDPWNATQLDTDLEQDGFEVVSVRQRYESIGGATKELERLVLNRGIQHPGNPVMDWMIGNVVIDQDAAGNIKPNKARSAEKIDGVAALINALALAIAEPGKKKTVYENKKIEEL